VADVDRAHLETTYRRVFACVFMGCNEKTKKMRGIKFPYKCSAFPVLGTRMHYPECSSFFCKMAGGLIKCGVENTQKEAPSVFPN